MRPRPLCHAPLSFFSLISALLNRSPFLPPVLLVGGPLHGQLVYFPAHFLPSPLSAITPFVSLFPFPSPPPPPFGSSVSCRSMLSFNLCFSFRRLSGYFFMILRFFTRSACLLSFCCIRPSSWPHPQPYVTALNLLRLRLLPLLIITLQTRPTFPSVLVKPVHSFHSSIGSRPPRSRRSLTPLKCCLLECSLADAPLDSPLLPSASPPVSAGLAPGRSVFNSLTVIFATFKYGIYRFFSLSLFSSSFPFLGCFFLFSYASHRMIQDKKYGFIDLLGKFRRLLAFFLSSRVEG